MSEIAIAPTARISSPLGEFWRRFRRKRIPLAAGMVILALIVAALFAPWIAPYDATTPDYQNVLSGPSLAHLAGTDVFGRDI